MVGVCGTPGTGKKTVAPLVAELMGLPAPISVNSLAPKGEAEVDTGPPAAQAPQRSTRPAPSSSGTSSPTS